MKNTRIHIGCLVVVFAAFLASCDDIFEKKIEDRTVQVVCPLDDAELVNGELTFAWNEEEGADEYHVVVVSPAFDNVQKHVCDTTLTGCMLELKLPAGAYQWSIQAQNSAYKSLVHYLTFNIASNEE